MTDTNSTQDRDTIINWAMRRSGHAAVVAGAHPDASDDIETDVGALRIGFPGYASEEKLDPISWDDFFEAFNDHAAAFEYEDMLPGGEISYVYRIVVD